VKLVTYAETPDAPDRVGVLNAADEVVALDVATMQELIAQWATRREQVAEAAEAPGKPLGEVVLRAPVRPRNNVMCVGKNYLAHAREFAGSGFDASQQQAVPEHPVIFTKALSSLAGPYDDVTVSADATGTSDYEGELGVVLGVDGEVFGYTVVNDLTVREVQKRHVQFFLGKSAPTYCPMGPVLLTADEVPDPAALRVRTRVNGEERQAAAVADLIFDVATLLATIGAAVRLEPGDVIATGTPAGVGIGSTPPRYLAAGDVVEVTIEPIGTLRNRCV
jgi:2-keto-4-pentenoate hydratase/2-oxohepta-3-ene-1,7-dioic acid hydratase in catechol pathway